MRSYLQQDISAFFDSLSVPILKLALAHLGAPPALAPLVEAFYSQQLRLFTVDSYTSDTTMDCCRAALCLPFSA